MQITTGEVNGTIFWMFCLSTAVLVFVTVLYGRYAKQKGEDIGYILLTLVLMLVAAVIVSELLTYIYGFTPTGWTL